MSLKDRVVIVTGAGRGLGRAYALELAARGATVIVNTRPRPADRPGSAEQVVAEIEAAGGRAAACALAVEDADAGERLLTFALERFGRLDGLVNNAGAPEAKSLHKQSVEDFRQVFEVNFFGTLTATLPAYRHMREQGFGRIVVSSSAAGLHGVHGMAAYSSSKAALIGLMRVIALEGGPRGVRCNAIAPFAFTGMTAEYLDPELGRRLGPEHAAPLVGWLMSPDCPLNGETLTVGAGKARFAARVEGPAFPLTECDGELAAYRLLPEGPFRPFDDGNVSFEHFLAAPAEANTTE